MVSGKRISFKGSVPKMNLHLNLRVLEQEYVLQIDIAIIVGDPPTPRVAHVAIAIGTMVVAFV